MCEPGWPARDDVLGSSFSIRITPDSKVFLQPIHLASPRYPCRGHRPWTDTMRQKDAICLSRRSKEWCPSFETAAKGLGELKNGVSRITSRWHSLAKLPVSTRMSAFTPSRRVTHSRRSHTSPPALRNSRPTLDCSIHESAILSKNTERWHYTTFVSCLIVSHINVKGMSSPTEGEDGLE